MAKLGGGGAKGFFINHGEKLALGLVGLLVLFALATANWAPYKGDPVAIKRAAEQAKVDFDARKYHPDEDESLGLTIDPKDRPGALVDRELLADWATGKYDLRVAMAVSPSHAKQPLREVQQFLDKHPIRNLQADASWVLLNLGADVPPLPDATTPDPTQPNTTPPKPPAFAGVAPGGAPDLAGIDDQFTRRSGSGGPGTGPGGPGGLGNDYATGGAMEYYSPELAYYGDTAGEGPGGMSYSGTKLKGRGQFFVAVRGIVPLHELIRDISQARNIDFAEAAAHFLLVDYQLERQVANADGTWPANDQWELVDRSTAESVLKEVDGFDLDPVPPQLTDVAVTMPLPPRITGLWSKFATHPDIESFSLSADDMDREMKFQIALMTKLQEQQAATQTTRTGPEVRGWNNVAYDSKRMTASLSGTESMYTDNYVDMESNMSSSNVFGTMGGTPQQNDPKFQQLVKDLQGIVDKNQKDKALTEYIKTRVTAVGNLLLFRYVDFAVEPGKHYRYRARLEIENPNFDQRVADAELPSVVEGETRFNQWSNVTAAASVPRSTYYFIDRLDSRRNVAEIDFYHYDSALGTIVSNTEPDPPEDVPTPVYPRLSVGYGEPIGGVMDIWELSPGSYSFAKDTDDTDGDPKGYAFNTGDLLVAGLENFTINRTEHPDLSIPRERNFDLQLADAVLVQKKDGSIVQIDTLSQKPWREYMAYILKKQNEPFRDLKSGATVNGEVCPQLADLVGEEMYDEGAGERRVDRRNRSALRKTGSRADASTRAATNRKRDGGA